MAASSRVSEPPTPRRTRSTRRRPDPAGEAPRLGSTLPRLFTPPLVSGRPGPCGCGCALTPSTSLGFAFEAFCSEVVERPLDPWQRWLAIHGLEVLPDGRPRFRQVLVLVARQNGKTELLVLLSLFWMYFLRVGLVLGTSTKLDYARESWLKVVQLARSVEELAAGIGVVRNANGEQEIVTVDGSRYKIAASNEEGGRSLTVHRLIEDELRQHRDYSAHEAADNAMNAVDDAQGWAISNQGDARSVVLNDFRRDALKFLATGEGDPRLGLFEWSAPDGCDVTDVDGIAAANPNLGRRVRLDNLLGKAQRAKLAGGEREARFRIEVLCQAVATLEPRPIEVDDWRACATTALPDPASGRVAFFIVVAPGGRSATVGAAIDDDDPDAPPHVELADYRPGTGWLVERCVELRARHPEAAFYVEAAGAVGAVMPELEAAGVHVPREQSFTAGDMGRACVQIQRLVAEKGFTHSGDELFEHALHGAVRRDIGEGLWVWGWRKSSLDISPIVAVTGALWALEVMPADAAPWGFYAE